MTRGLAEMTRLGIAAGANPLTFAGLAGIGDVIATCGSPLSRNHRLGVELARGRRWADIEADLPGVAEGAYTVDAAIALADRLGVEMPIAREVHRALFEGKSAKRCLVDLLARESKDELADYRPLDGQPRAGLSRAITRGPAASLRCWVTAGSHPELRCARLNRRCPFRRDLRPRLLVVAPPAAGAVCARRSTECLLERRGSVASPATGPRPPDGADPPVC